jgi:hypothetical protein
MEGTSSYHKVHASADVILTFSYNDKQSNPRQDPGTAA